MRTFHVRIASSVITNSQGCSSSRLLVHGDGLQQIVDILVVNLGERDPQGEFHRSLIIHVNARDIQ